MAGAGLALAYVVAVSVNACVTLLLRAQERPGLSHGNLLLLPAAVLALHVLGSMQVAFPSSSAYFYVQWACSAPLLWWLLQQLLCTLPPSSLSMPHFKRVALVEVVLAFTGLAILLVVDSTPVRTAFGLASLLYMCYELATNISPGALMPPAHVLHGPPHQQTQPLQPQPQVGAGAAVAAALSPMLPHPGAAGVILGSSGANGSAFGLFSRPGPGATLLPSAVETLVMAFMAGKLLQGASAVAAAAGFWAPAVAEAAPASAATAAAGGGACGAELCPVNADEAAAAMAGKRAAVLRGLWSASSLYVLCLLPLALLLYNALLRYAACLLVAGNASVSRRRTGVRRGSSRGDLSQQDFADAGSYLNRRQPSSNMSEGDGAAPGADGYNSDTALASAFVASGTSASTFTPSATMPQRLLEVGDLYRITESGAGSCSDYSSSGDEAWRDLALQQLLHMARTTLRGASGGSAAAQAGGGGGGAGGGAGSTSGSGMLPPVGRFSGGTLSGRESYPRSLRPSLEEGQGGLLTPPRRAFALATSTQATQTDDSPHRLESDSEAQPRRRSVAAPLTCTMESAVQCDLQPAS